MTATYQVIEVPATGGQTLYTVELCDENGRDITPESIKEAPKGYHVSKDMAIKYCNLLEKYDHKEFLEILYDRKRGVYECSQSLDCALSAFYSFLNDEDKIDLLKTYKNFTYFHKKEKIFYSLLYALIKEIKDIFRPEKLGNNSYDAAVIEFLLKVYSLKSHELDVDFSQKIGDLTLNKIHITSVSKVLYYFVDGLMEYQNENKISHNIATIWCIEDALNFLSTHRAKKIKEYMLNEDDRFTQEIGIATKYVHQVLGYIKSQTY
jgi:hypothetical protein